MVLPGLSLPLWRSLWCLFRRRRRKRRAATQLPFFLWPRSGLYHPSPSSLLSVGYGFSGPAVYSWLLEALATAASLPLHHWPTKKRSCEKEGWCGECVEQRKQNCTAPTNKWMKHPLCLSLRPGLLLWYSGSVSGRQILYCYVMNIFPPTPDSAEKAVSVANNRPWYLPTAAQLRSTSSHLGRRICIWVIYWKFRIGCC